MAITDRLLNRTFFITIFLFALLIPLSIVFFASRLGDEKIEYHWTNITADSGTLLVLKNSSQIVNSDLVIELDGVRLYGCEDSEIGACVTESVSGDAYAYITISNLTSDRNYSVKLYQSSIERIMDSGYEVKLKTDLTREELPSPERIYGRVVDLNRNPFEDYIVLMGHNSGGLQLAGSDTNGNYSISLNRDESDDVYRLRALTSQGYTKDFIVSDQYTKPVADIVLDYEQPDRDSLFSSIAGESYAANSCVDDTDTGGIRAQCNESIDWTENLNTSDCPASENHFRLGLIKHTTHTHFHNPRTVTLKLYDPVERAYVANPTSGEDLEVSNGGYVSISDNNLVDGREYEIRAFEGEQSCTNTGTSEPTVTINLSGDDGGGGTTPPPGPNPPNPNPLPPMPDSANLCEKAGENFAVQFEIPNGAIQRAAALDLRWGEGIITDLSAIEAYKNSVAASRSTGLNLILRLCYKNSCNVENGRAYGEAVVNAHRALSESGHLPQSGLFIHAGHNEPNNAEYRDPGSQAQFLIDVVSVVESAGLLSQNPDDSGIKLISPNLDLYYQHPDGQGSWPGCDDGCDDPNPHPIYNGTTYVDKMLETPGFQSAANKLYAWAVNDYLLDRGEGNVVTDVEGFIAHISSKGLPKRTIVTELGRINTNMSWEVLARTINELEANPDIEAILLFNGMGTNKDSNFEYHREIWDNDSLYQSLISNCGRADFTVPQEGGVDPGYETGPIAGGPPPGGGSSAPISGVNGSQGSSSDPYGGSYHGNDPCLGNICVGPDYQNFAVSVGGLLNGNFEGPFVSDGDGPLQVPAYWHVWYQNQCGGGKCGTYACQPDGSICRRPEYKQSSGFANRVPSGGGEASAQWFTFSGTMHAGLFQHIQLEQGGNKPIKFRVSGSSWSDDVVCPKDENGACENDGNCHCAIINKFIGRIGIDPNGGIDPTSGSVVWSDWASLPNVHRDSPTGDFTDFEIETESASDRITVFIAANNEYPYRNSDVYWDGAELYVDGNLFIGQANIDGGTYQQTSQECPEDAQGGEGGDACWDPLMVGENASLLTGYSSDYVLGASEVRLEERGEYLIESEFFDLGVETVANFGREPKTVTLFQDRDGDGVFDSDEFAVPSVNDVIVTRINDAVEFDLKPGLSLITVPFYTDDLDTAQAILDEIKAQGGYATAVSTYRNFGSKPGWRSVNMRGSEVYGDDYELVHTDAFYVNIATPVQLRLRGKSYTETVDTYLKPGWNLIAVKGGEVYKISYLLTELLSDTDIKSYKAAVWDSERNRFVTYVKDGNDTYGQDFNVDDQSGVFLHVEEGIGYWTPE